ncbi:hypothetical protein EPR50_G00141030 [Perca flavescens]|uniref:Uncharacterized protein n=1 Tax=Perca flavescens TaxID=8167 RepID=A0A484CNX2_PERFV|nr:hypothetical protein EPR50_G00141030 [Perca flavescens]
MRQPPRCLTSLVFVRLERRSSRLPACLLLVWLTGCVDVSAVLICPTPPTLYGIKTCNLGFILFTKTAKNTAERRRQAS